MSQQSKKSNSLTVLDLQTDYEQFQARPYNPAKGCPFCGTLFYWPSDTWWVYGECSCRALILGRCVGAYKRKDGKQIGSLAGVLYHDNSRFHIAEDGTLSFPPRVQARPHPVPHKFTEEVAKKPSRFQRKGHGPEQPEPTSKPKFKRLHR